MQITVVQPRVSAAGNRFISAFLCAIAVTPKAKFMVIIAGSPSGIAATAKDTDARKEYTIGNPNNTPSKKAIAAIITITMTNKRVKSAIFRINGVVIFRVSLISFAIRPISVCSPVATTMPRPEPRVMNVPLKAIQR